MYHNGFLKVAAASPKTRLGDSMYNVNSIIESLKQAAKKNTAIICFPELCISGYSIGDLLFQKYLYDEVNNALLYLLENNPFKGVVILGSYVIINDTLYNACFVIQKNKILGIIPKTFLPHTNEFYESRWFLSGKNIMKDIKEIDFLGQKVPFGKLLFEDSSKEICFGAEVCADLWSPASPNELLYSNGAVLVFNCSASPAHVGKREKRRILTKSSSMKFNSAYVYVSNNASESTSECVFSGHKIIAVNGEIIEEDDEISFDSTITYGDIDIQMLHYLRRNNSYFKMVQDYMRDTTIRHINIEIEEAKSYEFEKPFDKLPFVPKNEEDFVDVLDIQAYSVLKRLEYVNTNISVLGISGGLDSSLALLALVYAYDKLKLDRKDIHAISMPSKQTSQNTFNNGKELANLLGCTYLEIPIQEDVNRQLILLKQNPEEKDVTYENIQARFRTYTLMNYANKHKGIVIGTSDMSEVALGWATFNGDHMAMYGINAGLTKTALIATLNKFKKLYPTTSQVLDRIIATPISPELSGENQKTEDLIGKYEINDFILYHFLVCGADEKRVIFLLKTVFELNDVEAKEYFDRFNNRFYLSQYKRLTSPESAKILGISLSPRTSLKINGDMYRRKN
jgi:NAD+ synthase (glutamine-hydrolysing)